MDKIAVEVVRRYLGEEGKKNPGDVVLVSAVRAQQLIKKRVAKIKPPDSVRQIQEPDIKKSSGAPKGGPSTPTRLSSAPGSVQLLSVSLAGPASRALSAITSMVNKVKGAVGLSQ